jgi:excisionase family DNA binding protein
MKLLLRPKEVVEALGLSRSNVYQMLAAGEIPSIRVGRCLCVSVTDLESWIESQRPSQEVTNESIK